MPERPRALLIGGGVGIPPMVFLAETLRDRARRKAFNPSPSWARRLPFPFRARPSTIVVPGMPDGVIACMPLLDDWGVPSRLTSKPGFPAATTAIVTDLARLWLQQTDAGAAAQRWKSSPAARRPCSSRRGAGARIRRCPARSRWRNSWPARWAAAPAARWKCNARRPGDEARLRGWAGVRSG